MHPLSTVVFNPTSTDEQQQLVRDLQPLMHHTRDDRIEVRHVTQTFADCEEDTIYVIVHTGNLLGMIADLTDHNLL